MSNNFVTSASGLNLVRRSEGTVYHLYDDVNHNCTCGTGHLVHLGPTCGAASEKPFANGLTFDQEADLLRADLAFAEHAVNHLVTVPITQHEFDALVDFVFNLGAGTLQKSTLLADLNDGELVDVPKELAKYDRAGGKVIPALDLRRHNEIVLFQEK